jgi:hypothetical protein
MALPKARQEWMNLQVQDFTTIAAYNNELFRITSTLTLCGEPVSDADLLEKTLSTFHPSNIVLSTQYRNMRFCQYSELISHLLLAEKQQELMLRNAKQRPPGTLPSGHLPENHIILDTDNPHNQTAGLLMLEDPKGISKAKDAVNLPTGGVSLLLDLKEASNARSGNYLREEINCRSKIDFVAEEHQEDKVRIGLNKLTTGLDNQIPKA